MSKTAGARKGGKTRPSVREGLKKAKAKAKKVAKK